MPPAAGTPNIGSAGTASTSPTNDRTPPSGPDTKNDSTMPVSQIERLVASAINPPVRLIARRVATTPPGNGVRAGLLLLTEQS